jgi:hypothetical protein
VCSPLPISHPDYFDHFTDSDEKEFYAPKEHVNIDRDGNIVCVFGENEGVCNEAQNLEDNVTNFRCWSIVGSNCKSLEIEFLGTKCDGVCRCLPGFRIQYGLMNEQIHMGCRYDPLYQSFEGKAQSTQYGSSVLRYLQDFTFYEKTHREYEDMFYAYLVGEYLPPTADGSEENTANEEFE